MTIILNRHPEGFLNIENSLKIVSKEEYSTLPSYFEAFSYKKAPQHDVLDIAKWKA